MVTQDAQLIRFAGFILSDIRYQSLIAFYDVIPSEPRTLQGAQVYEKGKNAPYKNPS
jgi:hypothetical protein